MRRLHILGSSHTARILKAALNNQSLIQSIEVSGTVKPGARLHNLKFPSKLLQSFNELDVLIIQLFGNELITRNVYVSWHKGFKTIHLNAFEPELAWKILGVHRCLMEL